ncbi:tyrosine kinase receptor Cad96Ca-like [Ptychodera flava]|uniref:tyrosine kinase receptor Cad96Ca-like n=1 Tax=Ptychodera flava TaxID=63121 RepID=UPI00396A9CAC
MKSLVDNDNVIKLLACCTKTDPPYLIMEYAQCGNLKQFLTKHVWRGSQQRHDDGSSKLKLSFAVDIANGMNYLTAKGIVYRALSAKHVLLDRNRVCKLSNFGYCSGAVDEEQAFSRTTDGGLAFQWLSMETLSRGLFNMKTDVWSFGVVLWEIFSEGSDPYDGADKSDVIMKLRRGYRLLKPENCEDELYNLMCSCWLKNPSERPNFFQLWETLHALVATTKVCVILYQDNIATCIMCLFAGYELCRDY